MAYAAFWLAAVILLLGSVGYPLLLWAWATLSPRPVRKSESSLPTVSVVLPCHNEAAYIARKIENLLALDYPSHLLDVVLVSDGCTDGTVAVVSSFLDDSRLRLIEISPRHGKPHALNVGVAAARGDLILFSDSRQLFNREALRALVSNFGDPRVGAASGILLDSTGFGDGRSNTFSWLANAFRNLENRLKTWESEIHSIVGVYGALYAIRRSLARPLPTDVILDDMAMPFSIIQQGYRVVFEPAARASEPRRLELTAEVGRRRRVFTGGFQFLGEGKLYRFATNPVMLQWLLHKVVRLLFPFLLALLLASNLYIDTPGYRHFLMLQIGVHGLCIVAAIFKKPAALYLLSEFNISVLIGFYAAVTRSYSVKWQKQT